MFNYGFVLKINLCISYLQQTMEKFTEINPFRVKFFLIKLMSQEYRCKSDIAIFAWRITIMLTVNLIPEKVLYVTLFLFSSSIPN